MLLLLRFWFLIPIAILTATTAYYKHEATYNHDQLITYKATVEALGQAQAQRNRETIAQQQKVSNESAKSYQSRLDLINAEYARLRDEKAGSSRGNLPAIPDTARPTDDTARDQRLLEVLRAADQQTATLIELQGWIRALPR